MGYLGLIPDAVFFGIVSNNRYQYGVSESLVQTQTYAHVKQKTGRVGYKFRLG